MSELDASYYQAHKDDSDEWEDSPPPPRRRPRRRLDTIVSVRFSPHEQDLLRHAAERRRETLSTFIRQAALRAADQPVPTATLTGFTQPPASVLSTSVALPATALPRVHGLPRPSEAATASAGRT